MTTDKSIAIICCHYYPHRKPLNRFFATIILMRKYWQVMLMALQTLGEYRLNFITRTLVIGIINLVLFGFWYYLAKSGIDTSPYTVTTFAYYYLLVGVISVLISYRTAEIEYHVRKGEIVGPLLKPISYPGLMLSALLAERLVTAILAVIIMILLVIAGFSIRIELLTFFFFILSLFLAILVNYFLYFSIGLLSFWFISVFSFSAFVSTLSSLFSGGLIPIELLPEFLQNWSIFLPFRYTTFFPIQIFLQKVDYPMIFGGLVIEVFWILVFYFVSRILWSKGLKQLEAVGI